MMHALRAVIVAALFLSVLPSAAVTSTVTVSTSDKCPVCGMFVAKYPDFTAQIIFTDGSYTVFDGNKDMFKYYFDLKKYNASKELADIASIYVTDYYSMTLVDGRNSWYVIGSDVYGPMGTELIPFAQKNDADVFMKDHSGKNMFRFEEVTPDLIKGL